MQIGFIGQGWIGKNYADDFEDRGYAVVRYALEPRYKENRDKIAACDIVFIAVPTPTTEAGFDDSTVREVVKLVGAGKIAVIKSTMLPGCTESVQNENPDIYVLHSPEFLVEKTARHDASHPSRNIIGIPRATDTYRAKARDVLSVLPGAPYVRVMSARDAEFVKYAGNCFLFTKVVFINLLFDLVETMGGDWEAIRDAFIHDPRIGASHTEPNMNARRGAGGHCFIKDFEAFRSMYDRYVKDTYGSRILKAEAEKNAQLLVQSGKDLDLVRGVYGDIERYK